MTLKRLLIVSYGAAGAAISLFTAVMTYIIIDEPIGYVMLSEIVITVLFSLPFIMLLSYLIGHRLSEKFDTINTRLDSINAECFDPPSLNEGIYDIDRVHDSITQLSVRLKTSLDELQRQNENLKLTMTSLAHDIKTPLTVLSGYFEEFEDGLVTDERLPKVLEALKYETAFLDELSSDVVEFLSSMQRDRSGETIELSRLLDEEVFPLLTPLPGVSLQHDISSESLHFNRIDLKKILLNLLHNSARFTSEGSIRIYQKAAQIVIEDTGKGIDSELAGRMFEPFVTSDASRSAKHFGLGLSMARNLARRNGFELRHDATYDQGSRFLLEPLLPTRSRSTNAAADRNAGPAACPGASSDVPE